MNTALRNAIASVLASPSTQGVLSIYSGAAPASPESAATGTLLWRHSGIGLIAEDGQVHMGETPFTANAEGTGAAGYARYSLTGTAYMIQLTIGLDGADKDIALDSMDFVAGEPASITTFTFVVL